MVILTKALIGQGLEMVFTISTAESRLKGIMKDLNSHVNYKYTNLNYFGQKTLNIVIKNKRVI